MGGRDTGDLWSGMTSAAKTLPAASPSASGADNLMYLVNRMSFSCKRLFLENKYRILVQIQHITYNYVIFAWIEFHKTACRCKGHFAKVNSAIDVMKVNAYKLEICGKFSCD